jgi:hypothetical protein
MMRTLPGLGFLLVTFGTGIGTDGLGGIGCNGAVRSKAEDREQAAETKYARAERGPRPAPDRQKAVRSEVDNGYSLRASTVP